MGTAASKQDKYKYKQHNDKDKDKQNTLIDKHTEEKFDKEYIDKLYNEANKEKSFKENNKEEIYRRKIEVILKRMNEWYNNKPDVVIYYMKETLKCGNRKIELITIYQHIWIDEEIYNWINMISEKKSNYKEMKSICAIQNN